MPLVRRKMASSSAAHNSKACKLGKTIVAMSAHLGSDRQLALFRELIEQLATLRYLLADSDDVSRFEAYDVLSSSVAERELLKVIKCNVADRGITARHPGGPAGR